MQHSFERIDRELEAFKKARDDELELLEEEIEDLLPTYGERNWDGEDANPITAELVEIAQDMAREFPGWMLRPDVCATPHGEIDFDWMTDGGYMFTLSIIPSGEIAYAAHLGEMRVHGKEPWKGYFSEFIRHAFAYFQKGTDHSDWANGDTITDDRVNRKKGTSP